VAPACPFFASFFTSAKVCTASVAEGTRKFGSLFPWQEYNKPKGKFKPDGGFFHTVLALRCGSVKRYPQFLQSVHISEEK